MLESDGPPEGAAVLLQRIHRIPPYSLRHIRDIHCHRNHSRSGYASLAHGTGARRADRHEMARLAGGDPACGPGGTATRAQCTFRIWWVYSAVVCLR